MGECIFEGCRRSRYLDPDVCMCGGDRLGHSPYTHNHDFRESEAAMCEHHLFGPRPGWLARALRWLVKFTGL